MQTLKTIKIEKEHAVEKIKVKNNGTYLLIGLDGGSIDLEFTLDNQNSSFELYGIIIGRQSDEFKVNIVSHHQTKDALSRVHIKAVMFDSSKLDFTGLIKIDKGADLSDAYLKNDNLLIGESAVVNSSPQLEIKADDVKASHGVTISTISELDQFYLKSRGLTDKESKELLVEGFINEILQLSSAEIDLKNLIAHTHI
jgi:Fe-S cluster assembly protein SufD